MIQCLSVARRIVPAADGITEYTLEPLPLYGLAISWSGSVTAANTTASLPNLLDMLTNIEVLLAGTTLWQTNGRDLAFMGSALSGRPVRYTPSGTSNNDLSQVYTFLPFGRTWAGGKWGLPATPAGQLRLRLTADIAVGSYDTLTWSIDAVHDDSLNPDGFNRVTTLGRTAAATGDLDIDLPVGRPLQAVGLFSTTQRITEAGNRGIGRVKLLRDALDDRYPSAEWESLQTIAALNGTWDLGSSDHNHQENTAAAYTQNAQTRVQLLSAGTDYSYGFLDLDPARDGSQMLDLTNCNRAVARLTMDTAEAVRLLPAEWWPVRGAGATVPAIGGM